MNKKVEYFKYCCFFQEQRVPNRIEQRLKQNWTSHTDECMNQTKTNYIRLVFSDVGTMLNRVTFHRLYSFSLRVYYKVSTLE